jgi:predicted nucleic acid-binding protein
MATLFTVDASVFVAACRSEEAGHQASLALLKRIRELDIPMVEPGILAVEVSAALSRTGDDPDEALAYAQAVMDLPRLTVVNLDGKFCLQSADLAARCRLRAADALYANVAVKYGAHLVTLDAEQLRRAPKQSGATTPDDAMKISP